MKIAIEGCAHGELETIYDTIQALEDLKGVKIDLLICCGDFQSVRNDEDLSCMAVPPKYAKVCSFYKYYSGEKVAPILTLFIGGNHEASNYLQELPYGGWVAPNIYYMGYASVINIAGLRIAGLSGIYKSKDYLKGHYEKCPYDENSKRTVYHVRNLEIFRLKQLSGKMDIFLSHDWPSDIHKYGNLKQLLKRKPHFTEDVQNNQLGSKPCQELLHLLKPRYWFSAHLHCKYAALINHGNESVTKFLALDKCLPKRKFLQILDIPHDETLDINIKYDLEWLTILFSTNHLLNVKNILTYMPGPGCQERYNFTPTDTEMEYVLERFKSDLTVPKNFSKTAPSYIANSPKRHKTEKPEAKLNPQTLKFCETLAVDDPIALVLDCKNTSLSLHLSSAQNITDSFINDTIDNESDQSSSLNISQLKKLSTSFTLPNPKIDIDISVDSSILEETEIQDNSRADAIMMEQSDDAKVMEVNENSLCQEEIKPVESPTPRKLKRRNEELYRSE